MHYNPRQGSYLSEVCGHVVMGATDAGAWINLTLADRAVFKILPMEPPISAAVSWNQGSRDNVDYIVDEAGGRRAKDIKSICLVTEKSQHLDHCVEVGVQSDQERSWSEGVWFAGLRSIPPTCQSQRYPFNANFSQGFLKATPCEDRGLISKIPYKLLAKMDTDG
ncbi:unnamed protein product, partial [Mesorhabditis spiculigera]